MLFFWSLSKWKYMWKLYFNLEDFLPFVPWFYIIKDQLLLSQHRNRCLWCSPRHWLMWNSSCIRNEQTFPHWTWTIRNPNRAQEPVFYATASWCVWTQPSFQGQFSVSLSDWICCKIGHIPSGHPSPDTSVNGNGFRILLVLHIKHWFNSVATA